LKTTYWASAKFISL